MQASHTHSDKFFILHCHVFPLHNASCMTFFCHMFYTQSHALLFSDGDGWKKIHKEKRERVGTAQHLIMQAHTAHVPFNLNCATVE